MAATATRFRSLVGATAVRSNSNQLTFEVDDRHGTGASNINATTGALTLRALRRRPRCQARQLGRRHHRRNKGQETIDRANLLAGTARRIAVARAVYGAGQVPARRFGREAVRGRRVVLNAARRDLGLPDMTAPPFPEALTQFDAMLKAAYGSGEPAR
ncbi:hypothetical protein [Actinacidiphila glaucinigra]|uniref:hypothetical protein n=1 Tax=Actinacidiphila glaucinigra TaxID=235986 RepID=UPI0036E3F059